MIQPPTRTAFQEAADAPPESRLRRLERLLYRQPPPRPVPFSAQADDPRVFPPVEEGGGSFGRWMIDADGLPAFEYELDQYQDDRACYPNSEGLDRRDHWHQVGNFRLTGLASNDGTVQVYLCDRGGVLLNRFEAWEYDRPAGVNIWLFFVQIVMKVVNFFFGEKRPAPKTAVIQAAAASLPTEPQPVSPRGLVPPERLAQSQTLNAQSAAQTTKTPDPLSVPYTYAGGFGYLDDGQEIWATAFRYRPSGAKTRRTFGMGYAETEMTYRDIRVTRRIYAPYGDVAALLADVQLENRRATPVDLHHYEYWDVNLYQLQLDWLRGGLFAPASDKNRRAINSHFVSSIHWEAAASQLRYQHRLTQPPPAQALPPDQPCDIDWSPIDLFLADLSGSADAYYSDEAAFFGTGGAFQPDALTQHRPGDPAGSQAKARCLVLRRTIHLEPGAKIALRYAYGLAQPEAAPDFLEPYRQNHPYQETAADWKKNLVYFTTGEDPVLQREMAWHAYNLLSATVCSDFHGVHLIPQGSAYLFLHGADGAPRDQALFTLPMTYLHPEIARDMLRLIMRITNGQTGQVTYAFAGNGMCHNGMDFHTNPSDLDLFFLLALAEYLSATGDLAFLDEHVPFYPPQTPAAVASGTTVLDHVRVKLWHLFDPNGVGLGQHGLLKVRTGDWSDSIVLETALKDGPLGIVYENSKKNGESVPNTQLALHVLPLLAAIIAPRDPELSRELADPQRLAGLRQAITNQWNAQGWYNRAILRDILNQPITINRFDLEAQPWALISGQAAQDGVEANLIEKIDTVLDRPSPIGGTLLEGGMVWPAISQLLTWAYAHCNRPNLAWRSLNRNTFAMHAHVYPNIWFNIWSGPDGINGLKSDLPGGTWASPMTPMTDFPIMNANPDAMALLGLLRVCGIEPAPQGDGLTIKPVVPRPRFTLDLPLLRLDVEPGRIAGEYRAAVTGSRTLYVHIPANAQAVSAQVNGQPVTITPENGIVPLILAFQAGEKIAFEVRWTG